MPRLMLLCPFPMMSNVAVTVILTSRSYSMSSCIKNSSLKVAAIVVGMSVLMALMPAARTSTSCLPRMRT